ncbi:MAG TPA: glycosyltransferase 87 family protein, partial [Anaerolineales bacterium]|nr:glycosyltransferase 87 family protein [Anaerolineales bacterium]
MISTTSARTQTTVISREHARTQLLGWGAFMMCIYGIYVLVFPLVPTIYQSERVLDIEMILREGRKWFAPLYVLGLGGLFYAYWRVLSIVHSLSREDPGGAKSLRMWVVGIGVICGVILLGLYPITALDVVLYVVRARLWALYGGSPMLAVPSDFPQDPYIRFAGEYHSEVSPYSPLWELIAQVPIRVGILDVAGGILAMKVISLLSYVGMAALIGWYARQEAPRSRVSRLTALTFFALNPMVLMQAIGNGHNDMLMLAFLTLGLVLWQRDRWAWAALALTFAVLIKITGLILMPLFGVAVLAAAPTWRERLKRGLGIAMIFAVTTLSAYRLTGPFPDVFEGARHAMFDRWGYTLAY